MSFTQDWGPITALAFRTGTGGGVCSGDRPVQNPLQTSVSLVFFRRSACCGVRQSSGPHCILGPGKASAADSAEKHAPHSRRGGNVCEFRAAVDHEWSRQRNQGERQEVTTKKNIDGCSLCSKVLFLLLYFYQVWIFDQEGGGARLLRSREGHSAPPTTIHHHGSDGKNILSAGER